MADSYWIPQITAPMGGGTCQINTQNTPWGTESQWSINFATGSAPSLDGLSIGGPAALYLFLDDKKDSESISLSNEDSILTITGRTQVGRENSPNPLNLTVWGTGNIYGNTTLGREADIANNITGIPANLVAWGTGNIYGNTTLGRDVVKDPNGNIIKASISANLAVWGTGNIYGNTTLGRDADPANKLDAISADLVVWGSATIEKDLTVNGTATFSVTDANGNKKTTTIQELYDRLGKAESNISSLSNNNRNMERKINIALGLAIAALGVACVALLAFITQFGDSLSEDTVAQLQKAIGLLNDSRTNLKNLNKEDLSPEDRQEIDRLANQALKGIRSAQSGVSAASGFAPTVKNKAIRHLEKGSKQIIIGTAPFPKGEAAPPPRRGFSPKARYGLQVEWGKDFGCLQVVDHKKDANPGRRDTVLSWGSGEHNRLRFRYSGPYDPPPYGKTDMSRRGSQNSRDVVIVFPYGHMRVNGSLTYRANARDSDLRLKESIENLNNPIDKIMAIRGVQFNWKNGESPGQYPSDKSQIGVIAQEIEKIFPDMVSTDEEGFKAVDYDQLTPVLLEALKVQQKQIDAQEQRLKAMEDALRKLGALQS